MKISDVLEELGAIQAKHGDIDVYLGDWRAKDEHMDPCDKVEEISVHHFRVPGEKELKECAILFNY